MKIKDVNFLKLFKMLLISGLLYYKFDNSSLFIKKYPYINYYQDFFKEFYYNLLFYEFDLFMVQNPRIVSYFRYKDSILLVFDNITEKDKNLIIDKLTISFYLPVENINFDCIHYNKGDGKKLDLSMFKEIHFIKK